VVTDDLIRERRLKAGTIVSELAKRVGGGGGGRPHLATAGGKDTGRLDETLKETASIVKSMLPQK
jgi:alanyl-tRNA synthetase